MDGPFRHFANRREAGRELAARLVQYRGQQVIVLALPRGGIPVAYEIAKALEAPLDLLMVRKIGAPQQPELGIGAVVDGKNPQLVLNDDLVQRLGVRPEYIRSEQERQLTEIERRRQLYRGDRVVLDVDGQIAIVVDDGIATGATVKAALLGLARSKPARIVLAVPVASPESLEELAPLADEVHCLLAPDGFNAVGAYYVDFAQTTDEEVIDLLAHTRQNALTAPGALEAQPERES
ncbi:MAG TPA: phosphoribosyltransferase [Ferrovibrio sp.]|uniref:phosphoribosyltransferase n=1 Tax=Ferrovibrio sp. TaxID=1917215 RepID=UPI002ED2C03C